MKYVALVLFAAACFPEAQPMDLAELPDLHVELEGGPERLRVWLHASDAFEPEVCWRLADDFEARVAGRALDVVEPGTFDGEDCFEPILELIGPYPAPDATLVLEDSSKTISVPLGNMLVPRVAERVPEGSWSLSANQLVQVRIVPGDDLGTMQPIVSFITEAGEQRDLSSGRTGDLVTFATPASTSLERGRLEVLFIEWPEAIACEGAVCKRSQRQTWQTDATLSP